MFIFPTRPRYLIFPSDFRGVGKWNRNRQTHTLGWCTHSRECLLAHVSNYCSSEVLTSFVNKHQLVMLTKDSVDIGHMPCNLNVCVCLNNLMIRRDSFFCDFEERFSFSVSMGGWRIEERWDGGLLFFIQGKKELGSF